MNHLVSWTISAVVHATAIGAAAYFGAAIVVDLDDLELHLQRGRTVVEIQASVAASEVAPPTEPPIEVKRSVSERPPEPRAQAVDIERREPADADRRAQVSVALASPPATMPPPPARVEIEPDDPTIEPPPRRTIARLAPVAHVDALAVVASTGNNTAEDSPTLLSNPSPPYPADAYAARIEGVVKLDVLIDAQGRVREVTLLESSGWVSLDHAALRTVRDVWRFSIYRPGGVPTPYRREVPVRFRIGPR